MLKILMGPDVKILMGQNFGSWTHVPGSMTLGPWAGPWAAAGWGVGAHEYFHIWAHEYFSIPDV